MSTSTDVPRSTVAVRELVRLEDVHRAFGPLTVLEGINLRIDEGDRIGVVGHNGAGKTTLLRQSVTEIKTWATLLTPLD